MIEPSDTERATWPDATCDYVRNLEEKVEHLQDNVRVAKGHAMLLKGEIKRLHEDRSVSIVTHLTDVSLLTHKNGRLREALSDMVSLFSADNSLTERGAQLPVGHALQAARAALQAEEGEG